MTATRPPTAGNRTPRVLLGALLVIASVGLGIGTTIWFAAEPGSDLPAPSAVPAPAPVSQPDADNPLGLKKLPDEEILRRRRARQAMYAARRERADRQAREREARSRGSSDSNSWRLILEEARATRAKRAHGDPGELERVERALAADGIDAVGALQAKRPLHAGTYAWLLERFRGPLDQQTFTRVAMLLSSALDSETLDTFMELTIRESDPRRRVIALQSVEHIFGEVDLSALLEAWRREPRPDVRSAIAEALTKVTQTRGKWGGGQSLDVAALAADSNDIPGCVLAARLFVPGVDAPAILREMLAIGLLQVERTRLHVLCCEAIAEAIALGYQEGLRDLAARFLDERLPVRIAAMIGVVKHKRAVGRLPEHVRAAAQDARSLERTENGKELLDELLGS